MSDELTERIKKLEDQVGWIIDRNVGTVSNERVEKLEIQKVVIHQPYQHLIRN